MFAPFEDILDNNRQAVFQKLRAFRDIGSLGGGTAIALQINHRRSYDFDIFLNDPLQYTLLQRARSVFGQKSVQTLNTPEQINLITPEKVLVTFFYDTAKPRFPVVSMEAIDLLDLRDLASNKATTIGFRGKWRDYVDVYFLLKEGKVSLTELLEITEKRRGAEFSARLFLQQLVYFDDITDFTIDFVGQPTSPADIKNYLSTQVKALGILN